jgi:integrase
MLADHLATYPASGGFVFGSPDGGPLRPANFRNRSFSKAVTKSGLGPLRVHDLRHTCAALSVSQGAHAKEIADRLGHSSPTVTLNVYANILPSLEERLTDGLEAAFRTGSDTSSVPRETGTVIPLEAGVSEKGP